MNPLKMARRVKEVAEKCDECPDCRLDEHDNPIMCEEHAEEFDDVKDMLPGGG